MTKKTKTNTAKTVAKEASTVATKATKPVTEQTKRPTIASLQKEQANLTEQLQYANKRVLELEDELEASKFIANHNYETTQSAVKERQERHKEIQRLKESLDNRDRQIKELTTPLWKKAVDKINQLFGD